MCIGPTTEPDFPSTRTIRLPEDALCTQKPRIVRGSPTPNQRRANVTPNKVPTGETPRGPRNSFTPTVQSAQRCRQDADEMPTGGPEKRPLFRWINRRRTQHPAKPRSRNLPQSVGKRTSDGCPSWCRATPLVPALPVLVVVFIIIHRRDVCHRAASFFKLSQCMPTKP